MYMKCFLAQLGFEGFKANLLAYLGGIHMSSVVVVGTQWGDEGKGKITDFLSENAEVIARYQGEIMPVTRLSSTE